MASMSSRRKILLRASYHQDSDKDDSKFIDEPTRNKLQNRHTGIIVNKKGIGNLILPGDYVIKTDNKSGAKRKVLTERTYGFFWMLKDLKETDNKTIISNSECIPIEMAKQFPRLGGGKSLTTLSGDTASFPEFFVQNNRLKDATAQCTLVSINYNDHGYKMLPSWTEPFRKVFVKDRNRAQIVQLSVHEGLLIRLLRRFIISALKNNTPADQKALTLSYFGECDTFRDVLRMHNNKTCYVFLLDGLGRVRFAGSGAGSEKEVNDLIILAKDLIPELQKIDKKGYRGQC